MQKNSLVLMLVAVSLLGNGTAIAQSTIMQPMADDYTPTLPIEAKGMMAGALTDKFLTNSANPVYFPLSLPDRGTRFAKVSFSFTDANSESGVAPIQFDLEQLQAFAGTPDQMGTEIAIQSSWIDETGTLWIQFDQPIAARTQLTIVLKPKTLPPAAIYGYGVAAYSATQPVRAIFVEDGSLTVSP
jgi:Protein of unknown function (DUF2808)